MVHGYQLCAATEGKSPNAIAIVTNSISYFKDFIVSQGISPDVAQISHHEIREFILYLQQKRCFSNHHLNHIQDRGLSGHTINCYLRSLRIFFSWVVSEGILESNPFDRVKIPRPPRKIISTFSDSQVQQLLAAIDMATPEGYRDYTIILTLLDTAMRVSELCHLKLDNVWLEDGILKVLGKGNKERLILIGKQVQRLLWHYINRYRPEPAGPNCNVVFLTREGRPLTKDRVEKVIAIFTEGQLRQIFKDIDTTSPTGYRDYTIIITLLDTGIRCSELTGLGLSDVNLHSRLLKVRGKGSKERLVPIGAKVQKATGSTLIAIVLSRLSQGTTKYFLREMVIP